MKIYLIDRNFHKFSCLKAYFGREDVVLVNDSFESFISQNYVQCVVSPANSFGLMDGGYDLALINWYGEQLKETPQKLDWQYAEEMELVPEKDFRREMSWGRLLHELNENSK